MSLHATATEKPVLSGQQAGDFAVTRNACKLCTPLGASLAFKGMAGTVCILHGSQGCATYIRRYLISHFREPMDLASSNFTEHSTVFGGKSTLHNALDNLVETYDPAIIGVATTCLAETIGEDLPGILRDWLSSRTSRGLAAPALIGVNTPSYQGTHREGFQSALRETVRQLAVPQPVPAVPAEGWEPIRVNLVSGMVSPADLRWLRQTMTQFGLDSTLLPDYSETLDGGLWSDYTAIPPGGTSLAEIRSMADAKATIELGALPVTAGSAGSILAERGVPLHSLDLPIGIGLTDRFLEILSNLSGQAIPPALLAERSRLADSYVDAHKYLAGLPVLVFGEEDLVIGLAAFLAETGLKVSLCASGGKSGLLESRLPVLFGQTAQPLPEIRTGIDFIELESQATAQGIQLAVGSSKGFKMARALDIPLIRTGFPVHDRFGGQRIQHLGYTGAQQLFDQIINAVLGREQERNPIGYTYF